VIAVAVAGLGRVGAAYPEQDGLPPRTHLSAVRATPGLKLVAIVDPNRAARDAARKRHGLNDGVFEADHLDDLPAHVRPVLVVLSGPVDARMDGLAWALARGAKAVFCEKPFASTIAEGTAMIVAAARHGTTLRVNFHRRFDPGHIRARKAFAGRPIAAQLRYAKGLTNYGSHLIDLVLDWLGMPAEVRAESPLKSENPGFRLRYADRLEVAATGLTDVDYDVFEIDFHFRNGRLELANGGVERRVWRPVDNPYYPGYRKLEVDPIESAEGPVSGLSEFYIAARNHLRDGSRLPGCDGQMALSGLKIITAVRQSAESGGCWVKMAEKDESHDAR
jgi:predicted dehydrogenase